MRFFVQTLFVLGLLIARVAGGAVVMEAPAVTRDDATTILAAIPLVSKNVRGATQIEVKAIRFSSATRASPEKLPLRLTADGSERVVVDAIFKSDHFDERGRYVLEIAGAYKTSRGNKPFAVRRAVTLPPSSPGSSTLRVTKVPSHEVRGAPFRPQAISRKEQDVNRPPPLVPVGRSSHLPKPASSKTIIEKASQAIRTSGSFVAEEGRAITLESSDDAPARPFLRETAGSDIVFVRNTAYGSTGGVPNDPSGASGGGESADLHFVFLTGNTYASYSTNGGSTFTQLDPTTIFPNDVDGGLCCDQVVHYSSNGDRIFWLMQFWAGRNGSNRLRLAASSPEALEASNGTAWTYWDITSDALGVGGKLLDYPDLAVGNKFLYFSVDGDGGLIVGRIPLIDLYNGGAVSVEFTDHADGASAYGNHLIQNAGDEMFWQGHPATDKLRIFSCKENSHQYSWKDVGIDKYPYSDFKSPGPDGSNWLGSLFSGGPGGVRVPETGGDEIWFEWMGARGGDFPQPHVQIVRFDSNTLRVIAQTQIWNPDIAFGYASFAVASTREVGMSLAYGGGGSYGTAAVGIFGDYVVYQVCTSSANATRYGDYSTIRKASPDEGLYSAVGYCTRPGPAFEPHYVLFGRSGSVNPAPIL
jgi:hypothetical protein